jgi:hypothetical protein
MMLKRLALGFCLGSVLVGGAAFAQAPKENHGGTPEEQKACSRDVARYCKSVMNADDLTVLGCLQQNRPKLTPACLKVLESHGV